MEAAKQTLNCYLKQKVTKNKKKINTHKQNKQNKTVQKYLFLIF